MSKFIQSGEHSFILGKTQNGKTYFAYQEMKSTKQGVLFINPQKEKLQGFIKADGNNEIDLIIDQLRKGYKINYIPSLDDDIASKEIAYIVDELFKANFSKGAPIFLVLDETHIFNNFKEGKTAIRKVARRGLAYGINAIYISQRGSGLLDMLSQCEKQYIFKSDFDKDYFKNKGLPFEDIVQRIDNNGKYSFVIWNGLELSKAYKL